MKYPTATLKQLKAAIKKTGVEMDVSESRPNEMSNQGVIEIVMDQDLKLQFKATGCTAIYSSYYSDDDNPKESRLQCFADLIREIEMGFEPMTEDTAWACGVDL